MAEQSKIVFASSNAGKIKEVNHILANTAFTLLSQSDLQVPDAQETGLSFVENAIIKARNACLHTGLAAIADDSGLEVDALQGAPGIYSARYCGEHGNNQANNTKLLTELATHKNRHARFVCVMVLLRHAQDPTPLISQGTWQGEILTQMQGEQGFGYDPLFYVPTHQCSAAELAPEIKNQISHRAQALRGLQEQLTQDTHSWLS